MANKAGTFIKRKLLGKNKNLISLDEPFEVIRRLLKGHSVTGIIDAGASDGRISKRLLKRFPAAHAYAFEPNPLYAESLLHYAKQDQRFHPHFLALSDHEGTAELYMTQSPGCTSLFKPGKRLKEIGSQGSCVENKEKVQLVTIDDWAERNGSLDIQLMKFDIQGAESKALDGATRVLESSTLLVYTEIWFNCPYEGGAIYSEIDLLFREHGFSLYDMYKPKYDPNGLIMWANAIFVNLQKISL